MMTGALTFNLSSDADLIMAACFNGRERNIRDWRQLFKQADRGFAYKGVTHTLGSSFCLMEHVWEA